MSSEKVNDEECETCPIVRCDYIPGTDEQASTDEVVITAKKKEDEPTTMAASTDEFLIFRAFEQIEADYAPLPWEDPSWRMASGGLTHIDPVLDILSGGSKTVGTAVGTKVVGTIIDKKSTGLLGSAAKSMIWSYTKKWSSVKNVLEHWKKHRAEFPEFINAKQYVEGTRKFLHNSPSGTLVKTISNCEILKYHPGSNTFGVMLPSGVPKTMFRPKDGILYWHAQ